MNRQARLSLLVRDLNTRRPLRLTRLAHAPHTHALEGATLHDSPSPPARR